MEGGGAKRGPLQRRRRAAFYGAARRRHNPPPGSLRPSVLNSEQDGTARCLFVASGSWPARIQRSSGKTSMWFWRERSGNSMEKAVCPWRKHRPPNSR